MLRRNRGIFSIQNLSACLASLAVCGSLNAAVISIDASYTQDNPYNVTGNTSDSFQFTDGGWMSVSSGTHTGTFSGNGNLIAAGSGRPQIHFNNSFSDFTGTIYVQNSAWYGFNASNYGSENIRWVVNTTEQDGTGLLLNTINTTVDNPIKLGSLTGNGDIRPIGNQNNKVYHVEIGHLLTDASSTDLYMGKIRWHNNDNVYVTKVGAGKLILGSTHSFSAGLHIKEGTIQIGNASHDGKLADTLPVVVEAGASLIYNRDQNDSFPNGISRLERITLNGGTISQAGKLKMIMANVNFAAGGTVTTAAGNAGFVINNPQFTGEAGNARAVFDLTNSQIFITGTPVGDENQEIYTTGNRGNFLQFQCGDMSQFHGTLTAGPSINTTGRGGTWIRLSGATADFSTVTINPDPGKGVDAGILLVFNPGENGIKFGALSGSGIIRSDIVSNIKFNIQVGAKNIDTTFSGGFQSFNNTSYSVEKVGTGRWTITSSTDAYSPETTAIGGQVPNEALKTLTITEGTVQLGDYNPADQTGGKTGSVHNAAITIGENGTLAFARVSNNPQDAASEVNYFNSIVTNGGTIEVLNPNLNDKIVLRGATTGSFTKTGPGSLAIGYNNGDKLTQITVKEGVLRNYGAARLGDGATKIVLDGGTFEEIDAVTLKNLIQVASTGTIQNHNTYIHQGNLQSAAGTTLTKSGPGTFILDYMANFSGNLIVEQGTFQIGNNTDAFIHNDGSITVKNGASYGYKRVKADSTVQPANNVTVENGKLFNSGDRDVRFLNVNASGITLENSGSGNFGVNLKKLNGVLTLNSNRDDALNVTLDSSGGALYLHGISSANENESALTFNAGPRGNWLVLSGDMSSFHGSINLTGDRWFAFASGAALGSEHAAWNTNMTSNSGLLMESTDLSGKIVKLGDLTGNAWVRPGNANMPVSMEIGALGNDSTFSGALRHNEWRLLEITKVGDGTWTFASEGQANGVDYNSTATITIREGTIALNRAANQTSGGNMTVEKDGTLYVAADGQSINGTLTLKGGNIEVADGKSFAETVKVSSPENTVSQLSGTIAGNVDILTGTLSPGTAANSIGSTTITGTLTLNSGAFLQIDTGRDYLTDKISVKDLVIEDGAAINWNLETALLDAEVVELLEFETITDANGNALTPEQLVDSDMFVTMAQDWILSIDQDASTGMSILSATLTGGFTPSSDVPEPSTWALLVLGGLGLCLLRKNRAR